jgi:serine/threonine protein kinase
VKPEQRIQGRYTLIEPLGHGGMAEVWLARDGRLERDVAVKFMAANLTDDAEFLVRFFAEAQAVARISHPNVVAVLDFGELEGRPYLVMECVHGGALGDLTGEPMSPERAVEVVTGAARGAGAAHRAGLVHRDVKPANILLDDSGHAKLADFGIASSAMSERLTATGTAIGSPHYISPEQASARSVTAASDVYSLGAVLYELLTGRPPFEGDNVTAIAIAHVEEPPVPPGERVEGLPQHLDEIVLACLAKDPAARPPDGNALAEALEARAATARFPAPAGGEEDDYLHDDGPDGARPRKRWLVPALLAASVALALAGAVYVSGRPDDVATAGTDTAERSPDRPSPRPNRATPTPVTAAPALVAPSTPGATPSPSPTPEPETPAPRREAENEGPPATPDPTPGPTEAPAPSEEPTPPPSEEPTPAPSEAPG